MKISKFNPIKQAEIPNEFIPKDAQTGEQLLNEDGSPLIVFRIKSILCKDAREALAKTPKEDDEKLRAEHRLDVLMSVIDSVSTKLTDDDGNRITKKNLRQVLKDEPWLSIQIESFAAKDVNIDPKKLKS